jgi:hypothetical protein
VKAPTAVTFINCVGPDDTLAPIENGLISSDVLPVLGDGSTVYNQVQAKLAAVGITTLLAGNISSINCLPAQPSWIQTVTVSTGFGTGTAYLDWNSALKNVTAFTPSSSPYTVTFTITTNATTPKKLAVIATAVSSKSNINLSAITVNGKAFGSKSTYSYTKNGAPYAGTHKANAAWMYVGTKDMITLAVTANCPDGNTAAVYLAVEP